MSATIHSGEGMAVDPVTGNAFTITNTGVLEIQAGSGIAIDQATGVVGISASGGLVNLFDNTPTGIQLPGDVQGIVGFNVLDDGNWHSVMAGLLFHVFGSDPVTCSLGWDTQSGLLPHEATLKLFDVADVQPDQWVLGNAGWVVFPGNGGQLNLALLSGSGAGAELFIQVWCTP